jgi:hypothetical protein
MKKLFAPLGIAALLAMTTLAQTNPPLPVVEDDGLTLTNKFENRILGFAQEANQTRTLVTAVYPSYAPSLLVDGDKKAWGFGASVLYPINDFLYTGLRVDYLGGNFWAPSINVGLKATVQVFGVNVTPMLYTGAVVPLSGAGDLNKEFGYITGGGATVAIWRGKIFKKDAVLNLAASAEKWSQFDGNVYHISPVLAIKW